MKAARVDANQADVLTGLRLAGYRVHDTHGLGGGFPDALVGTPWRTLVLIEIKDGQKPPSRRQLTADETTFHADWHRFPVFTVTSAKDAIEQIDQDREREIRKRGESW